MIILTNLYLCLVCHAIGDYVLQSDYLATTKGKNLWHLIMHALLYTVPFAAVFGIDWKVLMLFVSHGVIDYFKSSWNAIDYLMDQILHFLVVFWIYFMPVVWRLL